MCLHKAIVIPQKGTYELLEGWVKRMKKRRYVDIPKGTSAVAVCDTIS
jgi:hypothetical protein